MNIYPINNKTDHFLEKYIFLIGKKVEKKIGIFGRIRSKIRIRLHIKMKRIRNTG